MCRNATVLKAERVVTRACRYQIDGWVASTERKKTQVQLFEFFWPRTITHLPPTIPESLTQIGPGISEIMIHQLHSSPVLGYQASLAIARSALIRIPPLVNFI